MSVWLMQEGDCWCQDHRAPAPIALAWVDLLATLGST